MDIRILLLAIATFATGTAENIVIGILPDIASGVDVSIGLAGQLAAVFSITFALATPMALQSGHCPGFFLEPSEGREAISARSPALG